jgi:hypothetical protein
MAWFLGFGISGPVLLFLSLVVDAGLEEGACPEPITRREYDDLREQNQRTMVSVYGLIAAGGGTFTLVIAELDAAARLPTPPASERA